MNVLIAGGAGHAKADANAASVCAAQKARQIDCLVVR